MMERMEDDETYDWEDWISRHLLKSFHGESYDQEE